MNEFLNFKIYSVVEDDIATALSRELDDDTMLSFNSKELVLFVAQLLIQTIAAPFVNDAYEHFKEAIISKADEKGVVLTEEDSKKMFNDTFLLLSEAGELDESWKKNWKPYEK